MKKFLFKKTIVVPKLCILFLLFSVFLFTSCGKDKTIEKIIYGDTVTNGNILNKEQFNSVSISREFNSINDFRDYVVQCNENKTNLVGVKLKINTNLNLIENAQYYKDYYYYKFAVFSSNTSIKPYTYCRIGFVNTGANSTISYIENITFIITGIYYYSEEHMKEFTIDGYSYL